jgi:hypothetical protein
LLYFNRDEIDTEEGKDGYTDPVEGPDEKTLLESVHIDIVHVHQVGSHEDEVGYKQSLDGVFPSKRPLEFNDFLNGSLLKKLIVIAGGQGFKEGFRVLLVRVAV